MRRESLTSPVTRMRRVGFAVLMSVVTLVGLGGADASAQSNEESSLVVQAFSFGQRSYAAIVLDLEEPIASVRVHVPRGYGLELSQTVGSEIGSVTVDFTDASRSSSAFDTGTIVVDDPSAPLGGQAETCAPGAHSARWRAELSILGRSMSLPIYVDASSPQGDDVAALRLCPVWQGAGEAPVFADYVTLLLEAGLTVPSVADVYTWRAFLEPAAQAGGTFVPAPASTFEVRSAVAHPHTITLRADYDSNAKSVVLRGRVMAAGRPEPRVRVRFAAFGDNVDDFTRFGPVTTDAAGKFSIRRAVRRSTTYTASIETITRKCLPPSSAPAGCATETVSPPEQAQVSVRLRGAREARLVPLPRDQALARRASLRIADFPTGWESFPGQDPFFPCRGFEPNLSKLTVHGEAESLVFIELDETAGAWTSTSVYASTEEARTAFVRLATIEAARCVAKEAADDGSEVLGVGTLGFPRLGDATRAFRIRVTEDGIGGFGDIVYIRRGRVLIRLGFVATESSSLEATLARAVTVRAR